MSVIEIESQLKKMSNSDRLAVIVIADRLVRKSGRSKSAGAAQRHSKLRKSAEIMLSEYCNDKELTAFSSLDSEDFLDA